jgi:arylsulfatase B
VVLIVADDQGYGEMSCQGGTVPTPHMDELARSGVRFTSGYVTAPFCSPSRAGFMTGRYQQRFGHEGNPVEKMNDRPDVGLPVGEKTMADYFKAAGYVTGMFGKWHLGTHEPYFPLNRGFDEFYGFLREGHYYLPPPFDNAPDHVVSHLRAKEPDYNRLNPIYRQRQEVQEERYLTEAFGREAINFIDRHKNEPFFLYVPFNAPHSPMQATPKDYARFADIANQHRRVWAAMLAALDDQVGQILNKLRQEHLEQDTIVFFISDNGGPTEELTSSNAPLSGGKGSLLEGGIRLPFVISWPGHLPAGRVDDRAVISLDILPTAMAAAGISEPSNVKLDGVNLLPYLSGERTGAPHDALYWRLGKQIAIRSGNWKLVRHKPNGPFELFDLSSDISEHHDLGAQQPERAGDLKQRLMKWNDELMKPLW